MQCAKLFLLSAATGLLSLPVLAQDVAIVAPGWVTQNRDVMRSLNRFPDTTGRTQIIAPSGGYLGDAIPLTENLLNDDAAVAIWMGWSATTAENALSVAKDQGSASFVGWDSPLGNVSNPDAVSAGVLTLGAGYAVAPPAQKKIISVPYGYDLRIPIVSAVPIKSMGNSTADIDDIQEQWVNWLYKSRDGMDLQQQLSLFPVTSGDSGMSDVPYQVVPRPFYNEGDDDGCGCGEHSSCDPDGYGLRSFSDLKIEDNFAILPGIPDGNRNDREEGGCECQSYSMSLFNYLNSEQATKDSVMASANGSAAAWANAMESLQFAAMDPNTSVTLFTCNPDG